MRQRIYNSKYYQKSEKRSLSKGLIQADKDDEARIYKELQLKLKKKKGSLPAIREMLQITFKGRRSIITKIEDQDPSSIVLQHFPFFNNQVPVSNNIYMVVNLVLVNHPLKDKK